MGNIPRAFFDAAEEIYKPIVAEGEGGMASNLGQLNYDTLGWAEGADAFEPGWVRPDNMPDVDKVRQLRHRFGPFLAHFSAPVHPTRAVCYALLRAHADRGPNGAWNPMLCSNWGFRSSGSRAARR